MNRVNAYNACGLSVRMGTVLMRAVILVLLAFLLFRGSMLGKLHTMCVSSEWTHGLAWPILVLLFLWCRREDLKEAANEGSNFGLVLFILSAGFYLVVLSFGLFKYLFVFALAACVAGAIWYAAGRRVLRVCIPLLLMLIAAIPLSERSMDRFTLSMQREIRRATAICSRILPSIDLHAQGKTLTYTHDGTIGEFAVAEQRLGARWLVAFATIAFFIVFCRRRSLPKVVACLALCIPVGIACKLLHLLTWAAVAVYGGFSPVSTIPRNIALVSAFVFMAFGVMLACGLVEKIALIPEMFVVESSDEDDLEEDGA